MGSERPIRRPIPFLAIMLALLAFVVGLMGGQPIAQTTVATFAVLLGGVWMCQRWGA